ncbi:MAG: hypothetical protein SAL07_14145 [Oscillatoria sp. PMC 1051.18]|nr:hypothetical protein [Oscillatoria sp. PMC 1051.18]
MKLIQIEGFQVFYFYANEPFIFPKPLNQNLRPLEPFMEKELKNRFNLRLVITKSFFRSDIYYVDYLYFDPDQFPSSLDKKVQDDTFTDEDFQDSVFSKFQKTVCIYCKWKGPTLCIEHDCYVGNFELELKKMRKFEFKLCPNCGKSLRQSVLMIF